MSMLIPIAPNDKPYGVGFSDNRALGGVVVCRFMDEECVHWYSSKPINDGKHDAQFRQAYANAKASLNSKKGK